MDSSNKKKIGTSKEIKDEVVHEVVVVTFICEKIQKKC